MEYALEDVKRVATRGKQCIVLILVLMEYALEACQHGRKRSCILVLILVLMEYALEAPNKRVSCSGSAS